MSNFTTSHKSKVSENEIEQLVRQDLAQDPPNEKKNKNKFIKSLKDYICKKSGDLIYNQIYSQLPIGFPLKEFEDELVFSGYKK